MTIDRFLLLQTYLRTPINLFLELLLLRRVVYLELVANWAGVSRFFQRTLYITVISRCDCWDLSTAHSLPGGSRFIPLLQLFLLRAVHLQRCFMGSCLFSLLLHFVQLNAYDDSLHIWRKEGFEGSMGMDDYFVALQVYAVNIHTQHSTLQVL